MAIGRARCWVGIVAKLLTPTGLAGRSSLVRVYLAAGEKLPSVRLSWQLLWSAKEKENSDHIMWSRTTRKARGNHLGYFSRQVFIRISRTYSTAEDWRERNGQRILTTAHYGFFQGGGYLSNTTASAADEPIGAVASVYAALCCKPCDVQNFEADIQSRQADVERLTKTSKHVADPPKSPTSPKNKRQSRRGSVN